MLTWIVTSCVIGALAWAALQLFRETDEPGSSGDTPVKWELSEADWDNLLQEFADPEDGPIESIHRLAA